MLSTQHERVHVYMFIHTDAGKERDESINNSRKVGQSSASKNLFQSRLLSIFENAKSDGEAILLQFPVGVAGYGTRLSRNEKYVTRAYQLLLTGIAVH